MNQNQGNKSAKRTPAPRKKACQPCTVARTRCDLVRPTCSRCLDKRLSCEYSVPAPAGARVRRRVELSPTSPPVTDVLSGLGFRGITSAGPLSSPTADVALLPGVGESGPIGTPALTAQTSQPAISVPQVGGTAIFDHVNVTLLAPLDVSRIRDRWLDYYFTPTAKQIKEYPARVMTLIAKTLSTYPEGWIRNQSHLPPFIHQAQCSQQGMMPESLANCLSLLRLCDTAAQGSEVLVRDSIQRELLRLAEVVEDLDCVQTLSQHLSCLSALQAYLLLSIHTYFASKKRAAFGVFTPNQISALHDLVSKVSAMGILCPEEVGNATSTGSCIPQWEGWIIAEAKRRTIFCVYMFEDVYNFDNNAATYLAEELAILLTPTSKWLWQASDKVAFETEYSNYVKAWNGESGLQISEFWPRELAEDGDDVTEAARRQRTEDRISRWAENVDEFGMFILAVCTVTHNA